MDLSVQGSQAGVAYAISQTEIGAQAAYDAFAGGRWELQPFVTLHEHVVSVGKKIRNDDIEFGLVDLCRRTSPGQPASARTSNYTEMECNCDDCRNSCGHHSSQKFSHCDGVDPDYSACTYYSASSELAPVARAADYCCNGSPRLRIPYKYSAPGQLSDAAVAPGQVCRARS